ncbi:type IV pilus modification PilV family protein [Pseudobythopirellula maris]|nr:DUF2141 domain-containing protein [Pseudobythopirellula maris]
MHRRPPNRTGFSLIEVVAATALVGGTLVATLELLQSGMLLSKELDRQRAMVTLAVSTMEAQMVEAASDWTEGTFTGDYATEGYPEVRYTAIRSDSAGYHGIPDRLMVLAVYVYHDENGNNSMDSNERQLMLATQVAKLFTYENAVHG